MEKSLRFADAAIKPLNGLWRHVYDVIWIDVSAAVFGTPLPAGRGIWLRVRRA